MRLPTEVKSWKPKNLLHSRKVTNLHHKDIKKIFVVRFLSVVVPSNIDAFNSWRVWADSYSTRFLNKVVTNYEYPLSSTYATMPLSMLWSDRQKSLSWNIATHTEGTSTATNANESKRNNRSPRRNNTSTCTCTRSTRIQQKVLYTKCKSCIKQFCTSS